MSYGASIEGTLVEKDQKNMAKLAALHTGKLIWVSVIVFA